MTCWMLEVPALISTIPIGVSTRQGATACQPLALCRSIVTSEHLVWWSATKILADNPLLMETVIASVGMNRVLPSVTVTKPRTNAAPVASAEAVGEAREEVGEA